MNSVTVNIEKQYCCDILVCGGGVSGFSAAVSAAETGADVMLIESGGFLGGTATKGLVGPFMTCYDSEGKIQIIRGLFERLVKKMTESGGAIHHSGCYGFDSRSGYRIKGHIGVTPFNHEALIAATEEMCVQAGVRLLYHSIVIAADTTNNKITRVYVATPCGTVAVSAKIFIDTTGNASLAQYAGAKTMRDDTVQTASLFGIINGVNKEILDRYMSVNTEMRERFFMDVFEKGQKDGNFPCGTQKLRIYERPDGNWAVNMAQVDNQFDELDTMTVTEMEIAQRKQLSVIVEFLKNNIPGMEKIKLIQTASDLGIRESRRIVGKTILLLEHLQKGYKFEDRIAVCANSIDIHQKVGVEYAEHLGSNYYIPLSCLISENITNLMSAGKSLSADKYAFAAVRVMPPCIAMGEAAGVAAAIAVKNGIDIVSDTDCKTVQKELISRGAYIE